MRADAFASLDGLQATDKLNAGTAGQGENPARKRRYPYRMAFLHLAFVLAFGIVGVRLVTIGLFAPLEPPAPAPQVAPSQSPTWDRPDILDRQGRPLALDIRMDSLALDPARLVYLDETVEKLVRIFPALDGAKLRRRLAQLKQKGGRFAWVRRKITPRQREAVRAAGIPGRHFIREYQRIYPEDTLVSHVLGSVDLDNRGMAGIERFLDLRLGGKLSPRTDAISRLEAQHEPVTLSLDLAVQFALWDELRKAREKFSAKAAAGLVLDISQGPTAGELLAYVSLPDFSPNLRAQMVEAERLDRLSAGTYELGSVFKIFTVAMAYDLGLADDGTLFDASRPLRVGRFQISDYHGKKRPLTVPEIFIFSSNIGAAQIALAAGGKRQRAFLERLGLLRPMATEIGALAKPILPKIWGKAAVMTIAYGHGLSVSPLQFALAAAPLFTDGRAVIPTFLKRQGNTEGDTAKTRDQIARPRLSPDTSRRMRALMRLNVLKGTGRQANVPGYLVGGKTGTADKPGKGGYEDAVISSFLAIFPANAPRYLVYVLLDSPQGIPETQGKVTAGVTAAPLAGRVIRRIAPILGMPPRPEAEAAFDAQLMSAY